MLDRVTGMQVFSKAVALGSITGAARLLHISPAMATKHLDALESRLGVKLIHRSTRRLSLTDAGRNYLEACNRILAEIEEADSTAASVSVEAVGLLRLSTPLSFGVRYIAPILPAFAEAHPHVQCDLGLNDRYVDLVEEGWDMTVRIGQLADSRYQARKLAECKMVVCAAPSYWERHGKPRRVAELSGHNCLGYSLSTFACPDEWCFGLRREIKVPVSGTLRANNGCALASAAAAGQGVIYEPEFIVAHLVREGALVPIALDEPLGDLGGIHVVYPPIRKPSAKVRAMIDFLVDAFQPAPWSLSV